MKMKPMIRFASLVAGAVLTAVAATAASAAPMTLRFGYNGRNFHPVFAATPADLTISAKARDFLHAHMRFQRMMSDLYKIIGDSVAEGLDIFGKD